MVHVPAATIDNEGNALVSVHRPNATGPSAGPAGGDVALGVAVDGWQVWWSKRATGPKRFGGEADHAELGVNGALVVGHVGGWMAAEPHLRGAVAHDEAAVESDSVLNARSDAHAHRPHVLQCQTDLLHGALDGDGMLLVVTALQPPELWWHVFGFQIEEEVAHGRCGVVLDRVHHHAFWIEFEALLCFIAYLVAPFPKRR